MFICNGSIVMHRCALHRARAFNLISDRARVSEIEEAGDKRGKQSRRILAVSEWTKVARRDIRPRSARATDKNRVSLKKGSINRSSRNKTQ